MDLNAISSWNSVGGDLSSLTALNKKLLRHNAELNRALECRVGQSRVETELERELQPYTQRCVLQVAVFIYRAMRRFAKGFGVGYSLRLIFALFPLVIKIAKGRQCVVGSFQRIKKLTIGVPVRYGLFVGSALSVFESSMRASRGIIAQSYPELRSLASGALAGASLLFLPQPDRITLGLFVGIRGLEVACNYAVDASVLPKLPHSDSLLFIVASGQVIWSWINQPWSLDLAYENFLDHHGGKDLSRQAYFGAYHGNAPDTNLAVMPCVVPLAAETPCALANPASPSFCEVLHPHEGCVGAGLTFFKGGLRRALPVYVPVYLVSTLVFRSKSLVKAPWQTVLGIIRNVLQSSVFLSAYCTQSWLGACAVSLLGLRGVLTAAFAGCCGGTSIFIERKSRRIELGLYVGAHALKAAFRCLIKWGWLKSLPSPAGEVVLFSFGISLLMHAFTRNPRLMRKTYYGLFRFFFGSGSRGAEFDTSGRMH